jgi:predicted kinase
MRLLIFLRGVSGTGKSTYVKGYENYTINPDTIRHAVAGVSYNAELDRNTVSQNMDKAIWSIVKEAVEYRMYDGQFIILDATFTKEKDMEPFKELAKNYLYDTLVLDFGNTPIVDNNARGIYSVPESVVARQLERYETVNNDNLIKEVTLARTLDMYFAGTRTIPFRNDKKVLIVGDIQGCKVPLDKLLEDFKEDTHYVFVGDYLDRGDDENYVLIKMMELADKPNVTLLMGNHELHLRDYCMGKKARSGTFNNVTLPKLEGITKTAIRSFLNKLHDACVIQLEEGNNILVTHAGIDTNVNRLYDLILKPSSHMWAGVKGYNYTPKGINMEIRAGSYQNGYNSQIEWFKQVFGHRNMGNDSYMTDYGAVCLESSVEHGGYLSVYDVAANQIIKYTNPKAPVSNGEDIPEFLKSLESYINRKLINKKTYNHIDSYSFSRKAFYDKSWDAITIKTRGLFVNNKTNKLVARGYDKFFNVGERGTSIENLTYPVQVFTKENGFLGLISYDHEKDELFITSKTSPSSEFSGYLKEMLHATLDISAVEFLTKYVKDTNTTFVFEVIDPVQDPHIVKYDKAHLVLLDIVHNTLQFTREPYEKVKSIAKSLGVKVKTKVFTANTVTELAKLIERSKDSLEEGFVLEDREGQFLKVKLPIYKDIRVLREIYKKGDWNKISREEVMNKYNDLPITRSFLLTYTQEQFEGLIGRNFVEKVHSQQIEELI